MTPELPVADRPAEVLRLGRLMAAAGRRSTHLVTPIVETHGLSVAAWWLLSELTEADGAPLVELARRGQFAASTITGASDVLAARDLVRRERDPGNRRLVRLWLTPAGRDKTEQIRGEIDAAMAGLYAHYAPHEQQTLAELLARLT